MRRAGCFVVTFVMQLLAGGCDRDQKLVFVARVVLGQSRLQHFGNAALNGTRS